MFETVRLSVSISLRNLYNSLKEDARYLSAAVKYFPLLEQAMYFRVLWDHAIVYAESLLNSVLEFDVSDLPMPEATRFSD